MPEVREVFDMATQKVRPDPDSLEEQYRDQRRHAARQKVAVFVLVGAIVIGGAAFGLTALRADGGSGIPLTSTTPSPTVPPSPFSERFDSPLNGLSVSYPSGWQTRPATEPWGHDPLAFDALDADVIFDPTLKKNLYLAIVSEPVGPSGSDWVGGISADPRSTGICPTGGGFGSTRLYGHDGWYSSCIGDNGVGGSAVFFQTAERGYIIYLHVGNDRARQVLDTTYDGDWIEAVLKSVVVPGFGTADPHPG